MTLTLRSKKHLEAQGYTVATVEHYNAFTKRKHDLYGCIDLLAIGNGETVAVQVTSRSNMSARIQKIEDNPALPEMIRSNWRIVVHGWDKYQNKYRLKEFEF